MASTKDEPDRDILDILSTNDTRADIVFKVFETRGWKCTRISGSHHIFTRTGSRPIPIAVHGNTLDRIFIRRILKQAMIIKSYKDDFIDDPLNVSNQSFCSTSRDSKALSKKVSEMTFKIRCRKRDLLLNEMQCKQTEDNRTAASLAKEQDDREALAIKAMYQENLDEVQQLIAEGDYENALQKVRLYTEKIDSIGTSSDHYAWFRDIKFYEMFALSEYSLSCCEFNSVVQQQHLTESFKVCTKMINHLRDRREETISYVQLLQQRVFDRYWEEIFSLVTKEVNMVYDTKGYLSNILNDPIDSIVVRLMSTEEANEATTVNDSIANSVRFIMHLKGDVPLNIPNDPRASFSKIICMTSVHRRSLVCCDQGLYDDSASFAKVLLQLNKDDDVLQAKNLTERLLSLVVIQPTEENAPSLYDHIYVHCRFVLTIIESLQFARSRFGWNRLEGVFRGMTDMPPFTKISFSDMREYMRLFAVAEREIRNNIACFTIGMGKHFTMESLYDPLFLIKRYLEDLVEGDVEGSIGRSLSDYCQYSAGLGGDRTVVGYRRRVVSQGINLNSDLHETEIAMLYQLLLWLTNLRELFNLLGTNPNSLRLVGVWAKNARFLEIRGKILPIICCEITTAIRLAIPNTQNTDKTKYLFLHLLIVVVIMEHDLDLEANWDITNDADDGKPFFFGADLGPKHGCMAMCQVSFDAQFRQFTPCLLRRWCLGVECRQLDVLQGLLSERLRGLLDTLAGNPVWGLEAREFQVFELCYTYTETSKVGDASTLDIHQIADILKSEKFKEAFPVLITSSKYDIKKTAKKYQGLISKLIDLIKTYRYSTFIHDTRLNGVTCLLKLLKASCLKHRHFPPEIQHDLDRGERNRCRLLEAASFLKVWILSEVNQVRRFIADLDLATERLTTLFHNLFGGNLPISYTMDSSNFSWECKPWTSSNEKSNRDLRILLYLLNGIAEKSCS